MIKQDMQNLKKVIETSLAEEFAHLGVTAIDVREDEDRDGDRILWVDVIYKNGGKTVDVKPLRHVVGKLRSALQEIQEDGFPVISYIDQKEWTKSNRAAR
jgi:hypothetical protein